MNKGKKTKQEIADAFKGLMKRKPFESITIAEITEACDLNRLTFYYHFQDKYALLNWIYYNEIIMVFKDNLSFENWTENLEKTLCMLQDNSDYYINALAYNNVELQNYMCEVCQEMLIEMIDDMLANNDIAEKDKKFISTFFAHGITGMVIDWTHTGMKESPSEVASRVKNIIEDTQQLAVTRYLVDESNRK